MSLDPEKELRAGSEIVGDLLGEYGFTFHFLSSSHSSGGGFASGAYVRGNRKLDLHFRWSLGMVNYYLGELAISHVDFMWSSSGRPMQAGIQAFQTIRWTHFAICARTWRNTQRIFFAGRT